MRGGVWASVVLVALASAGCLDGPTSSARGLLDAADAAAHAWRPGAELVSIVGFELHNGTAGGWPGIEAGTEDHLVLADDADPDGRAAGWTFAYRDGDTGLLVRVDAKAEVATHEFNDAPLPGAVGEWTVDSTEAFRLALDRDSQLREVAAHDEPSVVMLMESLPLEGEDGNDGEPTVERPVWVILASADGYAALVGVDARTGAEVDVLDFYLLGLFAEFGVASGEVNAASPVQEHGFRIKDRHDRLAVALAPATGTLPGQSATVVVEGPAGEVARFTYTVSTLPASHVEFVEAPRLGEYTARVELAPPGPDGVALQYRFSWCTDGVVPFSFMAGEACMAL